MDIVRIGSVSAFSALAFAFFAICSSCVAAGEATVVPADLPAVGTIDERFQSFNVEMVGVTGGPFWKPYSARGESAKPEEKTQSGAPKNADLFATRSPIDLASPRLRKFASALSPAYLRVSGTWANTTFFAGSDAAPTQPPAGYKSVLTRRQWNGVIDFSKAVDAPIVTSFAIGSGTRDAKGIWQPDQAREIISATRNAGGRIAAVEFMNEPDLPAIGGAPAGYGAAAFAQDFQAFRAFMKQAAPEVMILGPGTGGRTAADAALFLASAPRIDAVSYHYYGALSERCANDRTADAALSEDWLSGTDQTLAFYSSLRDRAAPGKPIWLTETAEAACGGDRWSATFIDSFRYLDQLGRLARAGVQVVMHNTLVGSDYGLLDEVTLAPRPNYWAALLWRQLMGTVVLDPGVSVQRGLHVYAHCQRHVPGAVVLLVINNDPERPHELVLPASSTRFTLDAANLQDAAVRLNGAVLTAEGLEQLPKLSGLPTNPGSVSFAPATITFLTISGAGNRNCN
jgi:Glycosyl hydrolase family 79, N-terminal domain